jgi:hypothetical protein
LGDNYVLAKPIERVKVWISGGKSYKITIAINSQGVTSSEPLLLCYHSFVLFLYLIGLYLYIKLGNINNKLFIN